MAFAGRTPWSQLRCDNLPVCPLSISVRKYRVLGNGNRCAFKELHFPVTTNDQVLAAPPLGVGLISERAVGETGALTRASCPPSWASRWKTRCVSIGAMLLI